jgi:host factor-I protein
MMPTSVQDQYLAEIKRQGIAVTIFLVNGFQLRGLVKGFDPFTIALEYEQKTHLIYKHAVSTISPQADFTLAPQPVSAAGGST